MNLSELIDTHRVGRSYSDLSRDCGGAPSSKRLQQLVTQPMKNFPDPPTVTALAKGLRVTPRAVVLAAAESLGLDVSSGTPRVVDLLPASARALTEPQAAAIAHLVRTIVPTNQEEGDGDATPMTQERTTADVLASKARQERRDPAPLPMAARRSTSRGKARRAALDAVGEESQDPDSPGAV